RYSQAADAGDWLHGTQIQLLTPSGKTKSGVNLSHLNQLTPDSAPVRSQTKPRACSRLFLLSRLDNLCGVKTIPARYWLSVVAAVLLTGCTAPQNSVRQIGAI